MFYMFTPRLFSFCNMVVVFLPPLAHLLGAQASVLSEAAAACADGPNCDNKTDNYDGQKTI
jgi:hypothetical protein